MNPCKCGGEVHLDYQQGDYTGQHWYAICNDCEAEYPLKSDNRIDAEREWNNRKEGKTMKSDFEEITGIAIRIMEEAGAYKEDEAEDFTVTRIRYIKEFADTIIGMAGSMELELGESGDGLR